MRDRDSLMKDLLRRARDCHDCVIGQGDDQGPNVLSWCPLHADEVGRVLQAEEPPAPPPAEEEPPLTGPLPPVEPEEPASETDSI